MLRFKNVPSYSDSVYAYWGRIFVLAQEMYALDGIIAAAKNKAFSM